MPARQRFYVELKEDETTVVSWKKLINDSEKSLGAGALSDAPAGANPALEARIAPEQGAGAVADDEDLPHVPNRFSSVIERIERLYKGGDSDEENVEGSPDEDQYDTDDPFIDDEELNEYFMVEKAKTKHSGFFINRGALEKISVASPTPTVVPKKRKRRDVKIIPGEKKVEDKEAKRHMKGRVKVAARQFPHSGTFSEATHEIVREHAAPRTHPSELEEISSDSDEDLQLHTGALSIYNQGKREDAGKLENKKIEGGLLVSSGITEFRSVETELWKDSKWKTRVESDIRAGKVERALGATLTLVNTTGDPVVGDLKHAPRYPEYRYGSSTEEKKWKESARDPKGVLKVSESLMKVKMMQAKEEGTRDSDEGAGKQAASNAKSLSPGPKESSPGRRSGWPKGTVMERAIQDLVKNVALPRSGDAEIVTRSGEGRGRDCPPTLEGEEPEQPSQSGGKAKRLPREVKIRLAKVARLAQAKQGKVPDELIERLNGILGHVMRPNTLKRNLKEMVELGLSAKQEKEGRIQDIKREVTEMVKSRVTYLQTQDTEVREGSSDDFQAQPGSAEKGTTITEKYKWDHAIEDLLCDLYEQYLEGMDEHKGPQIRKLYIELAELWPEGWMDNNGIKAAVSRAKERKKRLNKLTKEPRKKQKAGSSSERPKTEDDSSDSLAAAIKVSNIPNQLGHGVLVTKPKPPPMVTIRNDESTAEDRSLFLVSAQRTWPLAESLLKRKLPLEGMVRNPTKFSNLKEKVREDSESQRDGVVLGEKNPLLKKRRKKVKSGIEFDITAPTFPLVNIDEGIEQSVSKVLKKRPNITGELSDDEARRASMKVVKQKQPEKPPVIN